MFNPTPHIIPIYPPNNELIFEEWFAENHKGCNTDRELLPVFFTSFYVNNNYGNDLQIRKELQKYLYSLDASKKWFSIVQYDDSILDDTSHLDLLRFEMSKNIGVALPLLCMPHPFTFKGVEKKWFGNFVGSRTHPIRGNADKLRTHPDYFISFDQTPIETYCRIIHESVFTLCFRGYGLNSFRCAEAVQYGSIPVMISDEFIIPSWMNFEDFGVLIKADEAHRIDEILQAIPIQTVIEKQNKLPEAYENFYTYEANLKHIINYLETEYHQRQSFG